MDMEEQLIAAYREQFYFEKLQATNDYNEMAAIETVLDIAEESLNINIIYAKDGQSYFTFRPDCAPTTDNRIVDPIVMIYTSNIHCNYAHSIVSQGVDVDAIARRLGHENSKITKEIYLHITQQ